jgi:hypothetical protein
VVHAESPPANTVLEQGHQDTQEENPPSSSARRARQMKKPKPVFKKIPANLLRIDLRYQRDPHARLPDLRKIARNFDEGKLQTLAVNKRKGSKFFWMMDGGGRHLVVTELLEPPRLKYSFMCAVHSNLTLAEESAMFKSLNKDRKEMAPINIFKSDVMAGDRECNAIVNVMNRVSMLVEKEKGTGYDQIPSPNTFKMIFQQGLLQQVLAGTQAWREQSSMRLTAVAYGAVALFYRYMTPFDQDRLERIMAMNPSGDLLHQIKGTMGQRYHPNYAPADLAYKLVELYNHKLAEKNKLPLLRMRMCLGVDIHKAILGRWNGETIIYPDEEKEAAA